MSAPIPERWQELYAACKDGRYTSSMRQIEAIEQIAALSQANEQLFEAGEKTYQNFVRAADQIAALEAQVLFMVRRIAALEAQVQTLREALTGAETMIGFLLEYARQLPDFHSYTNAQITMRTIRAALAATEPKETA